MCNIALGNNDKLNHLNILIMYKVVYSFTNRQVVAKFEDLSAACCFLASIEPLDFVVYDSSRRVVASTKSMNCSYGFYSHYKTWCSLRNAYSPFIFTIK